MNLERQPIQLDVYEVFGEDKEFYWGYFSKHHYLTDELNIACRAFIAVWDSVVVGFNSVLTLPSGTLKNAYRGHRLVVSPDYQGLGIGISLSECVGEIYLRDGKRLFTKTANAKLGRYRNNSPKWRPTSHSQMARRDVKPHSTRNHLGIFNHALAHRVCFTHEYIGDKT